MSSGARAETRTFATKNALVVDADPQVEAALLGVLKPETWNIHHAPNNIAALKQAEASPFDLILTSEKTSGKEDVELLRKIRFVHPHTRLIVLADESTPADVIASMRARAFAYFSKPFSFDSLAEMIRMATEGPCWDDGIEVLEATPNWIRLLTRCEMKTADRLLQFLSELADLPEAEKNAVAIAFREMLLNAIEHGGHFDPNQYVEISYVHARHMVMCRVKDPGEGFSLEEIRHAAIANPPDDPCFHVAYRDAQGLRAGGYGILLARHLVDELIFSEKGNEVLLVKYLDWSGPLTT